MVGTAVSVLREAAAAPPPTCPAPPEGNPSVSAGDGKALRALGVDSQSCIAHATAASVFQWVLARLADELGPSFQGAAASVGTLGHDADMDDDACVSRLELLIALPKLVRPANWHDGVGSYIVQL